MSDIFDHAKIMVSTGVDCTFPDGLLFTNVRKVCKADDARFHEVESNSRPNVHVSWNYGARFGGPAPGMKKAIKQSGYDEYEFDLLAFLGFPSQPFPYRRRER